MTPADEKAKKAVARLGTGRGLTDREKDNLRDLVYNDHVEAIDMIGQSNDSMFLGNCRDSFNCHGQGRLLGS